MNTCVKIVFDTRGSHNLSDAIVNRLEYLGYTFAPGSTRQNNNENVSVGWEGQHIHCGHARASSTSCFEGFMLLTLEDLYTEDLSSLFPERTKTIVFDGKTVELSEASFNALKASLAL
jgi:hypothetical protein